MVRVGREGAGGRGEGRHREWVRFLLIAMFVSGRLQEE